MSRALTPALALDYVRELSADVRAAIVLDGAGRLLAGPPRLADAGARAARRRRRRLRARGGERRGVVCAVRSQDHAAVAVCGGFAIGGVGATGPARRGRGARGPLAREPAGSLVRRRRRAGNLAAGALERAVEVLISAAQRGFDG